MAANDLTQVMLERLSLGTPNVDLTQVMVEVLQLSSGSITTPVSFSLQKLVLTVKEATVPVRGRNQ